MKLLDFASVPDGGWYLYPPHEKKPIELIERRGSISEYKCIRLPLSIFHLTEASFFGFIHGSKSSARDAQQGHFLLKLLAEAGSFDCLAERFVWLWGRIFVDKDS